ncbi:MAG: zinc-finger domain-containing protein [Pseudomonadota bacterium]
MSQPEPKQPNSANSVAVSRSDLPLHCPTPDSSLWNSHPRVYVPLEDSEDGTAKCPYCGTEYYLVD